MAIQVNEEGGGKILVVQVSGKLTAPDYAHFAPEFERLVRQHGKLRMLFDMTGFHGWEASALWEDIKFDAKHFADIERLAMVGEAKWQKGTSIFRTPYGFHIAELRRKIPADILSFEEVREEIRRILIRIAEHQEYLRVATALRARADIRWIP